MDASNAQETLQNCVNQDSAFDIGRRRVNVSGDRARPVLLPTLCPSGLRTNKLQTHPACPAVSIRVVSTAPMYGNPFAAAAFLHTRSESGAVSVLYTHARGRVRLHLMNNVGTACRVV